MLFSITKQCGELHIRLRALNLWHIAAVSWNSLTLQILMIHVKVCRMRNFLYCREIAKSDRGRNDFCGFSANSRSTNHHFMPAERDHDDETCKSQTPAKFAFCSSFYC